MHVKDFNYGDFGADILLPIGSSTPAYLDFTEPIVAPREVVDTFVAAPVAPAPPPRVSIADVIRAGSGGYTTALPRQQSSKTAVLVVLGIGALLLMKR